MQKKNRASHKSVATKYSTEAESLIRPKRSVTITDAVIRLEHLHKDFSRKQTFLNEIKQQIQAKFDNEEILETDILLSEEIDDKLFQQLHQTDRFSKSNTPTVRGPTSATTTRSTPTLNTANIPKLDLPTSSGDYFFWTSFFDLFTGADHNYGTLQDSQKLQYLKASLQGDAAKLLASVTIADANYTVALKMLRDRYKNMILRTHVLAISTQKHFTNETAKDLPQLVETVEEQRLENMG